MKKIMKSLFMLFVAVFVLGACGNGNEDTGSEDTESSEASEETNEERDTSSSDEEVTLQFLMPGYDEGYLTEQMDAAVSQYEEENPNVTIEIVSAGWDDLNTRIVQLYQAGEAPDMMMMGSRSIRQFAEEGVLEDLGSYMTDEYLETRIDNVMESAQVSETQYGIPLALSSRALFYRSDLIDQVPATWEELLETAQTVSAENGMYGFAIPTDIGNGAHELMSFIYQNEGYVVDEDGEFTINSDANVETLEYLALFNETEGVIPNVVETDRDEQVQMFNNGDLAMYISGSWDKEELDNGGLGYGVTELPEGDVKAVNLVTDSYGISSISENKEAAWDFIEFMGTEDIQRSISEAYNWMPVTQAELEDERFEDDFMQPFLNIMEYGVAEPAVPNWDQFNESFLIAIQKGVSGQTSPQEALDAAQEEVTQ